MVDQTNLMLRAESILRVLLVEIFPSNNYKKTPQLSGSFMYVVSMSGDGPDGVVTLNISSEYGQNPPNLVFGIIALKQHHSFSELEKAVKDHSEEVPPENLKYRINTLAFDIAMETAANIRNPDSQSPSIGITYRKKGSVIIKGIHGDLAVLEQLVKKIEEIGILEIVKTAYLRSMLESGYL